MSLKQEHWSEEEIETNKHRLHAPIAVLVLARVRHLRLQRSGYVEQGHRHIHYLRLTSRYFAGFVPGLVHSGVGLKFTLSSLS